MSEINPKIDVKDTVTFTPNTKNSFADDINLPLLMFCVSIMLAALFISSLYKAVH